MNEHSIIVYMNGVPGDLVAAVIDNRDYNIDYNVMYFRPIWDAPHDRNKLKQDLQQSFEFFDEYIDVVGQYYRALASHHHLYHRARNHSNLIMIDDTSEHAATWSYNRLLWAYKNPEWSGWFNCFNKRKIFDECRTIDNLRVITVEDIMNGNLIDVLSQWYDKKTLDRDLYKFSLKRIKEQCPW